MSAPTIIIDSPSDLAAFAADHANLSRFANVALGDGFNLRFKLRGKDWDGRLDYRMGKFVLELQRDIMNIYNELTGNKLSFRKRYEELSDVIVTVEIHKGSTEILANLKEPLTALVKGMTGEQLSYTVITVTAIVCGGWIYKKYSERKMRADQLAADMKIEEGRNEIVNRAMETVSKHSTALANLLAKVDNDDEFVAEVDGKQEVIPVLEVKENLPSKSEILLDMTPKGRSLQVWGDFTLISTDNISFTFDLMTSGVPVIRKAITSFPSHDDMDKFIKEYADFLSREEPPIFKLLLSIVIDDDKSILGARILDVLIEPPASVENILDVISI